MVVVFGTVCRDRFHQVQRIPDLGGYVEIEGESEAVGGEAVNTALALKHWGAEYVLGGNSTGNAGLAEMLEVRGLSTEFLTHADHPEPVCDIYVTPDGQRTMFGRGFRTLGQFARPELVQLRQNGWFSVDANLGTEVLDVVRAARDAGMNTYLEDLVCDGLSADFWQSSTDWVGHRGDIQANVRWLADWLGAKGGFAVLSDGANGFVAGGEDHQGVFREPRHYPPFPCFPTLDSTGAGDIFRAGMLYGLDLNWPLSDCLRFASAAGGLNCRSMGANENIPTVSDINALISEHPEVARHYE